MPAQKRVLTQNKKSPFVYRSVNTVTQATRHVKKLAYRPSVLDVFNTPSAPFLKKAIALVRGDGTVLLSFCVGFFFFVLIVIYIALASQSLPPVLPLFYSLPWGNQQLIALPYFILTPILIPLLFMVDIIIGVRIYTISHILVRLLFANLTVVSLLLTMALMKIILLFY